MPIHPGLPLGTRQAPTQTENTIQPTTASASQSLSSDPGMAKNVTAAVTFVNGATNQLQAAAATFAAFAAGDTVLVEGSSLNNGTFQVLDTDASTYLHVAGGCKAEGPVTVTVRAI